MLTTISIKHNNKKSKFGPKCSSYGPSARILEPGDSSCVGGRQSSLSCFIVFPRILNLVMNLSIYMPREFETILLVWEFDHFYNYPKISKFFKLFKLATQDLHFNFLKNTMVLSFDVRIHNIVVYTSKTLSYYIRDPIIPIKLFAGKVVGTTLSKENCNYLKEKHLWELIIAAKV